MINKVVELPHDIWVSILRIANSIMAGSWFEIALTILGITGAFFTVQQIHLRLRNSSILISAITKVVLIVAGLFWILLMVAMALIAFVKS